MLQLDADTRGSSRFNLFVNGRGKVELSESLPFLRSADAVVGQLLHGHPVDAFRVPDPVVHLVKIDGSGSKVEAGAAFINTINCSGSFGLYCGWIWRNKWGQRLISAHNQFHKIIIVE